MPPWQSLEAGDPSECGGFLLTHRLGRGGFGTVFLGFRPDVTAPAAVKIFKLEHAAEEVWRNRFLLEIEMIKKMAGVRTASLLDSGGHDTPPWLATRYVQAPSLAKLVEEYGAFDPMCVWWLATGLGEALADIHSKGILHRDLKPQNILIAKSGVHVIDFGISRYVEGSGLTSSPKFFGTYDFAPIEQLMDSRQVTEKSDVFALGAVLMWVMTGRTPYQDVLWHDRVNGAPPDLHGIPPELCDFLAACVATNPNDRPTAGAVFTMAVDHLADYGIPLFSNSGLPLPAEIRDFVDVWAAVPILSPDVAVAATSGGTESRSSFRPGGALGPMPSAGPDTGPPQPLEPSFNTDWRSHWQEAVDRRRDSYGR